MSILNKLTPNQKLKLCRHNIASKQLDALIISCQENIRYLSDFYSRDSAMLLTQKECFFITDPRYSHEASLLLGSGFKIETAQTYLNIKIAELIKKLNLKRIGFEENYITFQEHRNLSQMLSPDKKLEPVSGIVEELRVVKTKEEIKKIEKAISITQKVLKVAKRLIQPGRTEIEIAQKLEVLLKKYGATGPAFPIIVASGPNSCLPHHLSGKRRIKKDDLVLVDIGADFEGYKSDLTRIYFLGKISFLKQKVFDIIKETQLLVIKRIKNDINVKELDTLARDFISKNGFGKNILHSLGHGIGLMVHEQPKISQSQNQKLKTGMVFTIEPGIYLPGQFGIRIEDMVVVGEKEARILSGPFNQ